METPFQHIDRIQATEDEQTIAALLEANDLLGEDNSRLRNSNTILRNVLRKLRETIAVQKKQLEQATFNDETFKSFCQGDFDPPKVTVDYEAISESMKDGQTRKLLKEVIESDAVQEQLANQGLKINKEAINKFFGEGTV